MAQKYKFSFNAHRTNGDQCEKHDDLNKADFIVSVISETKEEARTKAQALYPSACICCLTIIEELN
jgi:hypothetical protein